MPRVFFQVFRGVSRKDAGGWGRGFFVLHLTEGEKVDICGHIDLFFCSSLDFGRKTNVMTFK